MLIAAWPAEQWIVLTRSLVDQYLILAMCILQGEAGTGNVVEAVRHCRAVMGAIRQLQTLDDDELYVYAKEIRAPIELVKSTKELGRWGNLFSPYNHYFDLRLHRLNTYGLSSRHSIRDPELCSSCRMVTRFVQIALLLL